MYRIRFCHPITGKESSRIFKTLKAGYRFIRDFCCPMNFEVIPIDTSNEFYVYYDFFTDKFITVVDDITLFGRTLDEINV